MPESRPKVPEVFRIRITRTPDGPAPEEIRKLWVGMEMWAVRKPEGAPEIDPVTHEVIPERSAFLVPKRAAMDELWDQRAESGKAERAIVWFEQNFSDLPALSFGESETEVLLRVKPSVVADLFGLSAES